MSLTPAGARQTRQVSGVAHVKDVLSVFVTNQDKGGDNGGFSRNVRRWKDSNAPQRGFNDVITIRT